MSVARRNGEVMGTGYFICMNGQPKIDFGGGGDGFVASLCNGVTAWAAALRDGHGG